MKHHEPVEDPSQAAPPRTKGATRTYESDDLRVLWDASRCIHVAACLRALPEVFDVNARPWVDVSGAPDDAIAQAIRLCPTGALRYEAKGDFPDEEPEDPTVVEVRPNGPLYVRGRVTVTSKSGEIICDETRVALCRCGASENKPFCDNSHRLVRFRD